MEESKAKGSKYNLIAGILALALAVFCAINYTNYRETISIWIELYHEQIEELEEQIEELEDMSFSYWEFDDYNDALGEYDRYTDRLDEYRELQGFGVDDIIEILPVCFYLIISVSLFTKKKIGLPIGFLGLVILYLYSAVKAYSYLYGSTLLFCYGITFMRIASYIILLIYSVMSIKNCKPIEIWFLPIPIFCISRIIGHITGYSSVTGISAHITCMPYYFPMNLSLSLLIIDIIEVIFICFASLWMVFPNGIVKKSNVNMTNDDTALILSSEAYCGMVKHVLLLLFTFGVWYFIWIYKVTDYLNIIKDEKHRNPTAKLLLCMFVPFYSIYWTYKSARRIDILAKQKDLSSSSTTLYVIMAIFLPIIVPILMQDEINNIITAKKSEISYKQNELNTDIVNELKNYKTLLDSGIITQEEFEKKKNQLLDL